MAELMRRGVVLEEVAGKHVYNPTAAIFGPDGKPISSNPDEGCIKLLYRETVEGRDADHIKLAVSVDGPVGMHFDKKGDVLVPQPFDFKEAGGVEDARSQLITFNGQSFYLISYTAVEGSVKTNTGVGIKEANQYLTRCGVATTTDFETFQRRGYLDNRVGNMMCFGDKDVVYFPREIAGLWWALRRGDFGNDTKMETRLACSDNPFRGFSFGEAICELGYLPWANMKNGAGTQPIEIQVDGQPGWITLFHGVEATRERRKDGRRGRMYRVGAMIFKEGKNGPEIAYITKDPLLEPREPYETSGGLVSNVVFPTGAVVVGGVLKIYYGAGDGVVALCEVSLEDLVRDVAVKENSIESFYMAASKPTIIH